MKLVVTNAKYSPGTYHNMPSKLQATIQLFDHTWRAGMWFLHFTFSGADTKNVVASISVAGTPEELGRWWLKMPGNQQKALRTSQQHWSREPRASGGPTWGDASYNGAVEWIRRCYIVLRAFSKTNSCFCCFCDLRRCRWLKPPIHGDTERI